MAKEIIPPDPIPVGEETTISENLYCASFMDYSKNSYSDSCKHLLNYLEMEYENTNLGGTTRSFNACNTSVSDVMDGILNEDIKGINKNTIDKFVSLSQYDNDVIIFVNLY